MIESSICVPKDLGSSATDTPVPNTPVEDAPMQLESNKNKKVKTINLFFIF